jgi:hypothetical protein
MALKLGRKRSVSTPRSRGKVVALGAVLVVLSGLAGRMILASKRRDAEFIAGATNQGDDQQLRDLPDSSKD